MSTSPSGGGAAPTGRSFDVVAWARAAVGGAGHPFEAPVPAPPTAAGEPLIDTESLLVEVEPGLALDILERWLRAVGLTLGVFPEEFERVCVGDAVANDLTGAGATGGGFASLVAETGGSRLVLRVRRRPAVQVGRAFLLHGLAPALGVLRRGAQDNLLPELSLLLDAPAARFWLPASGDPDGTVRGVGDDDALLILIDAGPQGAAGERVAAMLALVMAEGATDLGQNVARAWAGSRYDPPRHAALLARAGYAFGRTAARSRWSLLGRAVAEAAAAPAGTLVLREVTGADAHGAILTRRTLAAAGLMAASEAGLAPTRPG